jgi:deoxyribose-phosphate aldolase
VSAPQLNRVELAAIIDHTLLAPEATDRDVVELCEEAVELGVFAVCVSANKVGLAASFLSDERVRVAAVVGFPSGAHRADVKAHEAGLASVDGAHELDMVIDLGGALAGSWAAVTEEIATVRAATDHDVLLKVIIESALLSAEQIVSACEAAREGGADFVKTSTGFHPAGGAAVDDVELMAATVAPALGVKASGGIRTAEQALSMVAAGATRLGMSRTAQVLEELDAR